MSPSTSNTLLSLCDKVKEISEDIWEHLYHNFISNPTDIEEIMRSTRGWKIVVVGITQKELKTALDVLKQEWYHVVDKSEINHRTNIYAVTIDPEHKEKSDFFVARWWE